MLPINTLLKTYVVYMRESGQRESLLAKVVAYREMVDAAKQVAGHPEFSELPRNVRVDIGKSILAGSEFLVFWDTKKTTDVLRAHISSHTEYWARTLEEVGELMDLEK